MRKVRPDRLEGLPAAVEELGLEPPLKTLVVVGGAERMSADEMSRVRPVIEALGELAERVGAVVVDGGTDEGVMRLLGQARARGRRFPLVGVVVASLAAEPEATPSAEQANLEPNHTHVVLVPGEKWGDEVVWIARVADVLAGAAPSATAIVNGGASPTPTPTQASLLIGPCSRSTVRVALQMLWRLPAAASNPTNEQCLLLPPA